MDGRNRFRALPGLVYSVPKRCMAFLLTATLILTNAGADLNTVLAATSSQSVTFSMSGSQLVKSIDDAIAGGNEMKAEDLDFTNGKVAEVEKLLFGAGRLYEVFPDIEGADMDAELRVFVRLPENADDMYMVTGNEEIIFLYVNNGEDTISCNTEITRMVKGVRKVKKTSRVTVKSYEEAYGNEEVNFVSQPTQAPVNVQEETKRPDDEKTGVLWETGKPTEDEGFGASAQSTAAADMQNGEAEASESSQEVLGGFETEEEGSIAVSNPETKETIENPMETAAASKEDGTRAGAGQETAASQSTETVITAETGPVQDEHKESSSTVHSETTVLDVEAAAPSPAKSSAVTEDTTAMSVDGGLVPAPASASNAKEEIGKDGTGGNVSKANTEALVGLGYCSTAKVYASTLNHLKALDDFDGYKVSYSIYPTASARVVDGAKGVGEGRTLSFGVKNQIGYAIDSVTVNDKVIEAESVTAHEDGSQTAWFSLAEINGVQSVEVYMTETDEHPRFSATLPMEDGTVIRLLAEEGVLPAGVKAKAGVVTGIEDAVKEKVEADAKAEGGHKEIIAALSYNIDLLDQTGAKLDGQIWNGSVQVTISGAPIEENSKKADSLEVMYVATTKEDEAQAKVTPQDVVSVEAAAAPVNVAGYQSVSRVDFEAEHFSVYSVTFAKDGKTLSVPIKVVDDQNGEEIGTIERSVPDISEIQYVSDISNIILKDLDLTGYTLSKATVGDGASAPECQALHMSSSGSIEYLALADMQYRPLNGNTLYFRYHAGSGKRVTFYPNGGVGREFALTAVPVPDGTGNYHFSTPDPENYGITRDGYRFVGWSLNRNGNAYASGNKVDNEGNWIPNVDVTVTGKRTHYFAIWLNENASRPITAYFYISTMGIPFEPSNYANAQYIPNSGCQAKDCGVHALKGSIKDGVAVNNNRAMVYANIQEAPDNKTIEKLIKRYEKDKTKVKTKVKTKDKTKDKTKVKTKDKTKDEISFDPKTQEIEWYAIKYTPYEWHVDGAIRNKEDHSVQYVPNGGDQNVPLKNSYKTGTSVEVDFSEIPSRGGYTFLGWDESASSAEPEYPKGGSYSFSMPDEDVTLYAIWRQEPTFL